MDDETLLVSADESLTDLVQAAAAATGAHVQVCARARAAVRGWARAGTVLVGVDAAPAVAGLDLPLRLGVHVVGTNPGQVLTWSAPLRASGLVLPDQAAMLTTLLDPASSAHDQGRADVLRVVGAGGGLGGSTLAAGLAVRGARRGLATVLVELDPYGGGIDLMFGAEDEPGWRWGDLASARGHLAELRGHLPSVCGVDLIAVGRATPLPVTDDDPPDDILDGFADDEARRSVLAAARRSYDLVVLDQGSHPEPGPGTTARRASGPRSGWTGLDRTLLLVAADVRGVLGAQAWLKGSAPGSTHLIVRTGPGRRLDPALVAQTLHRPLLGTLLHDGRAPECAEAGDPPGRARGRRGRALDQLLDRALDPKADEHG